MSETPTTTRLIIPALAPLYAKLSGLSFPIIRFFTGLMAVPHGAQKLFGWFGGDIQGTAGFFGQIGLEPALPLAYLVGATEFFGGLFLAVGFLTRPAAVGIAILMAVAVKVHLGNGYFWGNGGYEYPLLWCLLAVGLALRGGGEMSVDRAIGREF